MSTILGYVTDLANSIFGANGIGAKLIEFITASGHEIVLIPIAAWLVILCIGAIRKLVKGI